MQLDDVLMRMSQADNIKAKEIAYAKLSVIPSSET